MEGLLNKRAEANKLWQPRYFILKDNKLSWGKNKKDERLQRGDGVDITSCVAAIVPQYRFNRDHCFQISSTAFTRIYYLQASNDRERKAWMDVINTISSRTMSTHGSMPRALNNPRSSIESRTSAPIEPTFIVDSDTLNKYLKVSNEFRFHSGISTRNHLWREDLSQKALFRQYVHFGWLCYYLYRLGQNIRKTQCEDRDQLDYSCCLKINNVLYHNAITYLNY